MHPTRVANPTARRPKVSDRALDEMVALAWAAGWWGRQAGNYAFMYSPDMVTMIKVPSTPSDHRTVRNLRSKFRRAGVHVP